MKKNFDVVVVGELNVDLILNQIDQFPAVGREVLANNMTITLGSSSAIFASNLSTLGSKVAFVGRIGQDSFGDTVLANLAQRNVDTSSIQRAADHATGATVVLNFHEDRANITYPGAMRHLILSDISDKVLSQSRHLHVSSIFLQTGLIGDAVKLFKKATEMGLTTSLDPQWDPAEKWDLDLKALLPWVDVFMPNLQELKAFTKTDDLKTGVDKIQSFAKKIVVKNGNAGAFLWEKNQLVHQPPFLNKKVVDSIGAGDSFDAGFVHKFINKGSSQECLELGALTGAINTTRAGGTAAFENYELVKAIAQESFNYSL